jgi:hypothetical protein
MPTSNKKSGREPAARSQTAHGFARVRAGTPQPRRRLPQLPGRSAKRSADTPQPGRRLPQLPGTNAKPSRRTSPTLIGRVQATLPGRKAKKAKKAKRNGGMMTALTSKLGTAKNSSRSRRPSKKGMFGVLATAGLGAAAIAKRRRTGDDEAAPPHPPAQPVHSA